MSDKTGKHNRRKEGTGTHTGARPTRREPKPELPSLDLDAPLEPLPDEVSPNDPTHAKQPFEIDIGTIAGETNAIALPPMEEAPEGSPQIEIPEPSIGEIDLSVVMPKNAPELPAAAPTPVEPPAHEPVYDLNENTGITGLNLNIQLRPKSKASEQQISQLKQEVDDINKMDRSQNLTQNQTEILKRYISLKEAEARDVKEQQRQYQAFLKRLSHQLEQMTRKNRELLSQLDSTKRREDALKEEVRGMKERHEGELLMTRNDYEERLRKSGNYEAQVDDLMKKREEWRDKVKEDLKRIKLKERELENKYELLKRDTQALLDSKDKHVLELKKKNDALELELETLEERLRKSNTVLNSIDAKKRRLIETFKLAMALLEEIDRAEAQEVTGLNPRERKAG